MFGRFRSEGLLAIATALCIVVFAASFEFFNSGQYRYPHKHPSKVFEAIMVAKPPKPWIWQRPEWPEFYWDSGRLAQPLANARRTQGELIGMARS